MAMTTQLNRTTLILGGARSGKSAYAEKLILQAQLRPVYVATAQAHDDEMRLRISHHQSRRGANWTTIEEPLALCEVLMSHSNLENAILVDCLTLWLSNLMMAGKDIEEETGRLATLIANLAGPVVFVSNEVGMGLVPETATGREFRDYQGRLNQLIAQVADTVSFIAAGYPLHLKTPQITENNS
jgi:adenosylcobinamide kinase / adenosylcobinamide-phosphate guanylyltransferase